VRSASSYCGRVIILCSNIRWSTRSRRFCAAGGFSIGSYIEGDEIIPASRAASAGETSRAWRTLVASPPPKYVRTADSTPYAPLPK
jgi:hypothetical protein